MSFVTGWRLALRMAWRDVRRSRARSLLVLVMVTFPVVAVVAADVAQATSSVSAVEGLDRRLGHAEARIQALPDTRSVAQTADPDSGLSVQGAKGDRATLSEVEAALGGGSRPVAELRLGQLGVRTDAGVLRVDTTALDLRSRLTSGLFRLTSGRLPTSADELDANQAFLGHGFAVGDTITLADGSTRRIVGAAESTGTRSSPILVGVLDTLAPTPPTGVRTWLVGGAPVPWDQVRAVNATGATVLSREVVEHPPSTSELAPRMRFTSSGRSQLYAVLALIGVMALVEVVLLAGPAFAVGARRQSRALALIAANGGNPAQARRVVLGSAVVLGSIGAVAGSVLGIGLARLLLPVLQGMQQTYFGPFQIRWTHVAAVAAFGLLSAVLAAVVPAWVASRLDVVAVLAGRRGDRAASRRSPFIGVALLAVGVFMAVLGSHQGSGEYLIAGAAVISVFGMIFLVPVVVVVVARLGRRLPLTMRYAVRDAARHRMRTVPAIAAVAATVAGVVALSIANTSDQAQAKAQYTPELPTGLGSVVVNRPHPDWGAVRATVARVAPDSEQSMVRSVFTGPRMISLTTVPRSAVAAGDNGHVAGIYQSPFDSLFLVDPGRSAQPPAILRSWLSDATWARAAKVIARGGVLVFSEVPVRAHQVRIATGHGAAPVVVPAMYVTVGTSDGAPTEAVVSPRLVQRLGLRVHSAALLLAGTPVTAAQESTLRQALTGLDPASYLYVERGYQVPGTEKVVLLILFGLGGVLMLGGTLTATFLALSDARPDLATLSAVGGSPGTRRRVAAAYAVAVGLVGALLGAAVGFIPGIAVSYPLTRNFTGTGPSHYLEIPWLLIVGLVLALPLLTATVVGLVARSRLPVVARLQ